MLFNINKDLFQRALSKTQTIADKKASMQILSNVLLETINSSLIIKATNLEVGIKITCDADIKEEGQIILSSKALYDIVKEMPDDKITIKTNEQNISEITSGKAVFNIPGQSAHDFPKMMDYESLNFSVIPTNILSHMIEKTIFSISSDETRPFLNGAFFESRNINDTKFLRIVTTDGRRLSYIENLLALPENLDLGKGIIVPQKGLHEVLKNFSKEDSSCEIAIDKNFLVLKEDSTILYMRLIEGSYPDYKRAIPTDLPLKVYIDKNEFLASLKRISLISDEKTRSIRLSIKENNMKIYTDTTSLGDAKEDIKVECEGSEEIDIGFNSRFIMDILSAIDSDKLLLELKDSKTAGIITPINNENYLYLVMPLRV